MTKQYLVYAQATAILLAALPLNLKGQAVFLPKTGDTQRSQESEADYRLYSFDEVSAFLSDGRRVFPKRFPRDKQNPAPYDVIIEYPEEELIEEFKKRLKEGSKEDRETLAVIYATKMPKKYVSCLTRNLKDVLMPHTSDPRLRKMKGTYYIQPESFELPEGGPVYPQFPYFPTQYRISFHVEGAKQRTYLFSAKMAEHKLIPGCCEISDSELKAMNILYGKLLSEWERLHP